MGYRGGCGLVSERGEGDTGPLVVGERNVEQPLIQNRRIVDIAGERGTQKLLFIISEPLSNF